MLLQTVSIANRKQDRYVLTDGGAERDVCVALQKLNITIVRRNRALAFDVRPKKYPGRPQKGAEQPGKSNQCGGSSSGSTHSIRKWTSDRKVTIERNEQKIENGCVRVEVVEGEPTVANERTEWPVAEQQVHRVKRHRDETDQKVGQTE